MQFTTEMQSKLIFKSHFHWERAACFHISGAEEKQRSTTDFKRKMKHDEISNVKKQRVELEATVQSLTDGIIKEALLADDKKDPASTAKTAALRRASNQILL